jgi:putative thioredoxin|tara:strand:- start:3589 stop:4449 length:861 start_codon:yes stop_codon:yes gene_type:complete
MTLPPNFSQAVDLSSLGKPAPDLSSPMPGIEVTPQNLQAEILPLSETKPVVVLCWTPRSTESIELLRTLGKLEGEGESSWVLTRVNIDEQASVAKALQVRAVPYGVVFIGGQAIPFLEQALTETQLREVITKILTVAAQQGIGDAPVEQTEPEEDEALAALDQGDYETAEAAYKRLLARKPNDNYAKLGLAQVQLLRRTHGVDAAKVMEDAIKNPDNIDIQIQCADVEVMSGYLEPAFERLLRLLLVLHGDEQKIVKDRLLELFALADPADPRVIKARTQLANALF